MSPKELSDIEKRKADIAARAKVVVGAPAKKVTTTPSNDYGAYVKAEQDAGRKPKSKVEWIEALNNAAKARIKGEKMVALHAPMPGQKPGSNMVPASSLKEEAKPEKAKATKPAKNANELTVSDVAREMGIEPKVARARLRKDGTRATDGRWPTVTRDSAEHKALIAKLVKAGNEEAVKAATKAKKPAPVAEAPDAPDIIDTEDEVEDDEE